AGARLGHGSARYGAPRGLRARFHALHARSAPLARDARAREAAGGGKGRRMARARRPGRRGAALARPPVALAARAPLIATALGRRRTRGAYASRAASCVPSTQNQGEPMKTSIRALIGAAIAVAAPSALAQQAEPTYKGDPSVYKLIYEDANFRVIEAVRPKGVHDKVH